MPVRQYLRKLKARLKSAPKANRETVFKSIFADNAWQGKQSVSGRGSDLDQTAVLQRELPVLLQQIGVRRILDAPCGDFNWMRHTPLELDEYIGADIVAELAARNQQQYGDATRRFIQLDIVKDKTPTVDLIFCRDCLVHLPYLDILAALKNYKASGSTYLLTTTFYDLTENRDITAGDWRPLNLLLPPFNFPAPIHLLVEECPEVDETRSYADKSLGLWKLSDLNV